MSLVAAALLGAVSGAAPEKSPPPRDLGLVETTVSRLQQLDLTLTGPAKSLQNLGPSDFEVEVGGRRLTSFTVDRVCQDAAPTPEPAAPSPEAPSRPAPAVTGPSATYVFYFDHPHMTQSGRAAAIDLARDLVPKLLTGHARLMILSNALELRTYLPLTSDPAQAIAALEMLKGDGKEWDPWGAMEEDRVADVLRLLGSGGSHTSNVELAMNTARGYQLEERWRQERDLRRLEMILGRLADLDAPKAVLYFADTMRANAGEHYLSFFGSTTLDEGANEKGFASSVRNDADSARLNLDRVVDDAAALGIRFYTVEAKGLEADSTSIASRSGSASLSNASSVTANTQRHRDAQDTLVSLAAETGGRAFLNGVPSFKVARRILDDLSCVYLVSFDPRDFPKDTPLRVAVRVLRPDVKVQSRGRIVIQGDAKRLTSRLLASFAAPEATRSDVPLRVALVPLGFRDGAFQARVQVVVPGTPVAGAIWDLGASVVSRGKVSEDASGRVEVGAAGVPIILESEMSFAPGPYELVAVAHESTTDQLASKKSGGTWPAPEGKLATLGPIAVLQPLTGAFLRDGSKRLSGSVALEESDFLRPDQPTALVGLVCRSKDEISTLTVTRTLVGEGETPFPPTAIPSTPGEPCAQFRDLVPAKTLGEGRYRYVVKVSDASGVLAEAERTLLVPPRS